MFIDVIRIFRGANPYYPRPAIVVHLNLRDLAGIDPRRVPGLGERLLGALPGLEASEGAPHRSRGRARWPRRGTSLAHVVERVAVAFSALAGAPVPYSETRAAGPEGHYDIVLVYRYEEVTRHLAQAAVAFVEAHVRASFTAAGTEGGDGALQPAFLAPRVAVVAAPASAAG